MTKYTFEQTYEDHVTTKEFEADYLYDVIERFEEFLRGCGFYFNGRLEIVDEESDNLSPAEDCFFSNFQLPPEN